MGEPDWSDSVGEGCYIARKYYWGSLVAAVLIALLCLIGLCRKIVTLQRKQKRDGVYLQIVTDYTWENIKIGEACVPSEQLFLSHPQQPLIAEVKSGLWDAGVVRPGLPGEETCKP